MHKLNLKDEINSLLEISYSSRPWHTSLFTGLSLSGPLFIAAYFESIGLVGSIKLGVIASMAGLLFLYTLKTPIYHRMAVLMACGFGLMFSFIAGGLTHLTPNFISTTLGLLTLIVALGTRYYQIGGSYFFVMVATIIAFMPLQTDELIELTGYFSLGLIWAWMMAFLYSILTYKFTKPEQVQPIVYRGFEYVVVDSVIIAFFIGLSTFLALFLGFERPYWVPISTLAILQGMTLRSNWSKQIHRIGGTIIGLVLSCILLSINLGYYQMALMVGALGFLIDYTIVRNYGVATIFMTPLTFYMAEITGIIDDLTVSIMLVRVGDIAFGSVMGFVGGIFLNSLSFRARIKSFIMTLIK